MNTPAICVVVADVKAHYDHAIATGTSRPEPLEIKAYDGSGYNCHDLAGHIWRFDDGHTTLLLQQLTYERPAIGCV